MMSLSRSATATPSSSGLGGLPRLNHAAIDAGVELLGSPTRQPRSRTRPALARQAKSAQGQIRFATSCIAAGRTRKGWPGSSATEVVGLPRVGPQFGYRQIGEQRLHTLDVVVKRHEDDVMATVVEVGYQPVLAVKDVDLDGPRREDVEEVAVLCLLKVEGDADVTSTEMHEFFLSRLDLGWHEVREVGDGVETRGRSALTQDGEHRGAGTLSGGPIRDVHGHAPGAPYETHEQQSVRSTGHRCQGP